jgi:hypothetical protein
MVAEFDRGTLRTAAREIPNTRAIFRHPLVMQFQNRGPLCLAAVHNRADHAFANHRHQRLHRRLGRDPAQS